MTESSDDKVLDDELSRDSAISRAYRDMDTADIPPAIDTAIMAQARAAVARPRPSRVRSWTRWSAPLALAASVVIGVAVVIESGVEEKIHYPAAQKSEVPTEVQQDATASAAIEQVTEAPPPAAAPVPEPELLKAERSRTERKQRVDASDARRGSGAALDASTPLSNTAPSAPAVAPTAPAPRPAQEAERDSALTTRPAAADKLLEEGAEARRENAPPFATTRGAVPTSARMSPPEVADGPMNQLAKEAPSPVLSPDAWLERIRTLRREGKVLEADEQWQRFRDTYPEFAVTETDFARPSPR